MDEVKLEICCGDMWQVIQVGPLHRQYPNDVYVQDGDGNKWLIHYCPFCGTKQSDDEDEKSSAGSAMALRRPNDSPDASGSR